MTHEIDQDFDDGHGAFMVHVCNVPPTSSLSDIGILFAKAGLHHPFSFRVSESVVAVQLDTEAAVEAALALSGSILTPPKVGQINIPGQVIEVIQAAPATHAPTALFWPFEAPDCKPCIEKAREASAGFSQSQLCLFVPPKRVLLLSYHFFWANSAVPKLKAHSPTTLARRLEDSESHVSWWIEMIWNKLNSANSFLSLLMQLLHIAGLWCLLHR